MNIVFIGDIIGRPGRRAVQRFLPEMRERYSPALVIANVENSSGGFGVSKKAYDQLIEAGVGCATSGNHIWDKPEVHQFIKDDQRLLRPLNYGESAAGRGSTILQTPGGPVAVINLSGSIFMESAENPFLLVQREVERLRQTTKAIVVDFHAEATSEKNALGWYLDGKVSAVIGTHTHIPTADARLLPEGTAFMTDVGMTGPYDSVIGIRKELSIERFLAGGKSRFEIAKENIQFHAALIAVDEITGRAGSIEHIVRFLPPGQ